MDLKTAKEKASDQVDDLFVKLREAIDKDQPFMLTAAIRRKELHGIESFGFSFKQHPLIALAMLQALTTLIAEREKKNETR